MNESLEAHLRDLAQDLEEYRQRALTAEQALCALPSVDDLARLLFSLPVSDGCARTAVEIFDRCRDAAHAIATWPGRKEGEIKAEALREAERELDQWMMRWKPGGWGSNPADQQALALAADSLRWMLTRADRLEAKTVPR